MLSKNFFQNIQREIKEINLKLGINEIKYYMIHWLFNHSYIKNYSWRTNKR